MKPSLKRLQTEMGRQMAKQIIKSNPSDWWYADKKDKYWIIGGKGKK